MRRSEATGLKKIILHRVAYKYDSASFRLESFEYELSKEGAIFNKDKVFLFSFRDSMQAANETGAFLDVADAYKFVIDDVAKKKELEAKKLELLDNLNDNLKEALERLLSASV